MCILIVARCTNMPFNGFKQRSNGEFSDYQKRVEAIDNVILCVAEAEKMIREIGGHLVPEAEVLEDLRRKALRRARLLQGSVDKLFK
jgi:hypothetical protein